jgi:hypothetical protein
MASDGQSTNITEILEQPYQVPPSGFESDFVNRGFRHALGYFVVIFGAILSTIAVLLHLGST